MYSINDSCCVSDMVSESEESKNKERILQIAIYSGDQSLEGIKAGLKEFPVSKLVILFESESKGNIGIIPQSLSLFAKQLKDALDLDVSVIPLPSNELEGVLGPIKEIYDSNSGNFTDTMLNLTSGGKILACTSLASAFFFGIRAFYIDKRGRHVMPILKLGYTHMLSETKITIVKALGKAGGSVSSLEALSERTGLDKALISRHINGAEDSKGLLELGLVSVSREERGRMKVSLTALGHIMLVDF